MASVQNEIENEELKADIPGTGQNSCRDSGLQGSEPEKDSTNTGSVKTSEELRELNEKFLRLAADFDNYRKRTERDQANQIRYAIERFVVELVEVIDNFDRAIAAENPGSREGLEQIRKLFTALLERHGVVPIQVVGERFNPAEHEAVVCIPSDREEGIIVEEVCKGYRMHDKVVRCAKVAVSKGKE